MSLATTQGKKEALEALWKRREENAGKEKVDDASLRAGAPMHYYCISCDGLAAKLPEGHLREPPDLCDECQALKDLGWLE